MDNSTNSSQRALFAVIPVTHFSQKTSITLASTLLDVPQHFVRKIGMPIQSGADRGTSEGNLTQNFDRFLRAFLSVHDLLRVARKFLAESHRRRIHQMRPTDLNNVPKFFCLRF